jgi:hypothetical protein
MFDAQLVIRLSNRKLIVLNEICVEHVILTAIKPDAKTLFSNIKHLIITTKLLKIENTASELAEFVNLFVEIQLKPVELNVDLYTDLIIEKSGDLTVEEVLSP